MQSCDEILDWISAALDEQLNADEQAALEEHLAHCPACSALYNDLRTLQAATVDQEDIPAPAGFAGAVMSAISADPAQEQVDRVIPFAQPQKPRGTWKRWAASAAAVAIIAAGAAALPNFAHTSGNFDNAVADTAAEFSTAESAVMEQEVQESKTANDTSATYDLADYPLKQQSATYGSAAENGEVVNDSMLAPSSEPSDRVGSVPEQAVTYCGILTLSGSVLPEGLNEFEVTQDDQGNLTYTVSAEYFFSALDAVSAEADRAKLSLELDDNAADAEYGLIIVENPS